MVYHALMPAFFIRSLVSGISNEEERRLVEHKLRQAVKWLLAPTLAATTLVVVASIVPAAKAPVLHHVQYLCNLGLSLEIMTVRRVIFSRRLKRYVPENGQSSEALTASDEVELCHTGN